jgi:hypothetical protein
MLGVRWNAGPSRVLIERNTSKIDLINSFGVMHLIEGWRRRISIRRVWRKVYAERVSIWQICFKVDA